VDDGFVKKSVLAYEYLKDATRKHVTVDGEFDEHRFETVFDALKYGLAIVSIELEGEDDPQTIFETLNSRGAELTPGDLMRNFIFQRAKGMGQSGASLSVDGLYEKHWLPLDGPFWTQAASRGRQSGARLDWLLTDHLSMNVGTLVSRENLYESYRRWILNERPFPGVVPELGAISVSAGIEERLFEQEKTDPLGDFGRFAQAFDVSTVLPLVLYLATEADLRNRLPEALAVLKSYVLRRDICRLTTKNYNKLFVGLIPKLREAPGDQIGSLSADLSARESDIDRWPDDGEWREAWTTREQYSPSRRSRLEYLFEGVEAELRNGLNEDIEIKSALTIEHIMPRKWEETWPLPGYGDVDPEGDIEIYMEYEEEKRDRNRVIDTLGNLTLLTQKLNSSVSNGPYTTKMPDIRSHSSLALNRDLDRWDHWDEETIRQRGEILFNAAKRVWAGPIRRDGFGAVSGDTDAGHGGTRHDLPENGTECEFTYRSQIHRGRIENGKLSVEGYGTPFGTFSAASRAITRTSRNGWNDWYLDFGDGRKILADEWRKNDHPHLAGS
ncbi:MAG: HNH endonuclease family protein, partial [Rhodobacteraceae bacterium]|nr:HNH endonuclease family protein [Paracoccaceae bacterium]